MSHLLQLLSIDVLTHGPLENLRNDAQPAVQNVENTMQDRQIKHGTKHGAEILMVDLGPRRDAVVVTASRPGLAFRGRGTLLSSLWPCPMDLMHPGQT
jgi:hypothetical protein